MRRMRFGPGAVLAAALLAAPGARAQAGQASIELRGVPDELELPIARGKNVVLTAELRGGEPKAVWLARQRDDASRIMLFRVRSATYQINLSDPAVQALLAAEGRGGRFQVFAELQGGEWIASIPVYYAVAARRFPEPQVVIVASGKPEQLSSWTLYQRWWKPERVQRIELSHPEALPVAALARCGERDFAFSRTKGRLALEVTPALREAWRRQANVDILYARPGDPRPERKAASLRCVPDRLDMPGNAARMVIEQRRSHSVPGSHDYLRVHIGDITGGQVLLSLTAGSEEKLIERLSVSRGNVLQFELAAESYHLAVDRLVNLLVGDDYCELAVFRMRPEERARIERALRALESSGAKLLTEGRELGAEQGAAHLRARFDKGPRVDSFEQFLERIARGCRIEQADGKTLPAEDWLRKPPEKKPTEKKK
ncbi:MAG: DUF5329 family protein [Deltaproteobacteria bacterium]|nr:DUF5329 family protein [Deltaproteobacteria bacterium]